MSIKRAVRTSLPGCVLLPFLGVPALAQQASSGPAATVDATSGLPEIIVTAQKREENINKVGLTISAISSDALTERNFQSLSDIAASVPGLSYVNSANNTPVYNLRGVGFYDTSLGSYPTTSVYLDQVPLPFPVLTNLTYNVFFPLFRIPTGILPFCTDTITCLK